MGSATIDDGVWSSVAIDDEETHRRATVAVAPGVPKLHMSQNERGETVSPPHVSEGDVLPVDSECESLDRAFRALADHRRRCVCHYLARSDDPVPVAELAELLAASMDEKTRAVLTTAEIEKTRAELTRMHLPKLAEVGLVEHDRESGVVEFVGSPGVRACLDAAATVDFE